jgi:hypothetical protein
MKYRIKEEIWKGKSYFFPQYKRFLFWRDWTVRDDDVVVVYPHLKGARDHIELFKDTLNKKKKLDSYKQVLYHSYLS